MFDFDDYDRELKSGLLHIADALGQLREPAAATAFIGFESTGDYADESPDKVDLTQFMAMGAIVLMYDFAFAPTELEPSDDFEENHLASFIALVPRTNIDGEPTNWSGDLSQKVLDAFRARRRLDEGKSKEVSPFSIRELALLADMSEGAVRNSLSADQISTRRPKGSDGVEWKDAVRWLKQRRGFRSRSDVEVGFPSLIAAATSIHELFHAFKLLGFEKHMPRSWRSGAWTGDLNDIPAFAASSGLDAERLAACMAKLWMTAKIG